MLEHYRTHFDALAADEQALLSAALEQRYPEDFSTDPSVPLWDRCELAGLDQGAVVMSIAREISIPGISAIEKLIGQPITRRAPQPTRTKGQKRGRARRTIDNRVIVHVTPNPKKPGSASHARYESYEVGMTVTQALEAGVQSVDIAHDEAKGFIRLEVR
jgi:hypothetical protein